MAVTLRAYFVSASMLAGFTLGCVEGGQSTLPSAGAAPAADVETSASAGKGSSNEGAINWAALHTSRIDVARAFDGFDACFLLLDEGRNELSTYHGEFADTPFPPCSTFKIPHAVIALETGVVSGPDEIIRWSGKPGKRAETNHDHDLRSAIHDSVLWYFQEIARRVGPQREQEWLKRLHYGNENAGSDVTMFWIDGALRISAKEQLEFVRRLAREELPANRRTQQLVKQMLLVAQGDQWALFGKTGTGGDGDRATLGWFVGWLQHKGGCYYIAANMRAADGAMGPRCRDIVRRILAERFDAAIAP